MRLLSEANVARRCESCGEAARRSNGGAALSVCPPLLVGDDEPGDEAMKSQHCVPSFAIACNYLHLSDLSAGS
jgi:hypothetical protein